ncbi:MAG: GIY-YIG nuclease family protein [Patescibacteria group bacterium]|jgi:predicted GIY-YIG superfamily endonuclease
MYYIYILKCKDGYYVGCTVNIKNRIIKHKEGQIPSTSRRLPVKLDFYICFKDKIKAFNFEKYLKSGSGRSFIKRHF